MEQDRKISEEWNRGWFDGNKKALSLDRPFMTEDWPKDFQNRGSHYHRGYEEGVKSAELSKPIINKNTNNDEIRTINV